MKKKKKEQLIIKDPDLYAEIILEGYERGMSAGTKKGPDSPNVFLLGDFLGSICTLRPDAKVHARRLYGYFRIWYHDNIGEIAPSEKWFEAQMTPLFKKVKGGITSYYEGIVWKE